MLVITPPATSATLALVVASIATALALFVSPATASAMQDGGVTNYKATMPGLSPRCKAALSKVYHDKELTRCMNFNGQNNFTHLFFDNPANASVVNNAAIFASTTVCKRPACAEKALSTNLHSLTTSCSKHDLEQEKSPAGFISSILSSYVGLRNEACLVNMTAFAHSPGSIEGHPLCFAQLLHGIEQTKGVNMDLPNLSLLLRQDRSLLSKIFRKPESDVNRHFQLAAFCTDCLKASYSLVAHIKGSKTKDDLVKTANDLCGPNFLSDKSAFPKTVKQAAPKSRPEPGE